MIVLLVLTLILSLYSLGAFKKLMQAARLDTSGHTAAPVVSHSYQSPKTTPTPQLLQMERKKAEKVAANILHYEHYKGDSFGKAESMTDEEISNLIARFKSDIYGD